jgi:hypothetical protein
MVASWAGRVSTATENLLRRPPLVNFYLPEHHHVESVHLTDAKKQDLHPALAIVQTVAHTYW